MSPQTTRRDFVKQSTALGVAWWVGSSTAHAQREASPLERLNFACIGVGGKGSSDTDDAARNGNLVAICDIDENTLRKSAVKYPKAKQFADYRQMLDEMEGDIDAVTVSTPDHSHAPASLMAMKRKKHVFCQKPLTWSVAEARRMRETAKEMELATQMGNQGTSHGGLREAVEIVRAGGIGDVKEVHIWTNRPIWPQGVPRPESTAEVPKSVNWDLFLGPAPERPYSPDYHPFKWRGWIDFGTGALGDMACHTANMAVMALDLFDPVSVEAEMDEAGLVDGETYPKWSVITFQFPERNGMPPVKVTWYDGGKKPDAALLQGEEQVNSGSLLVGAKGALYSPNDYGSSYVLLPKGDFSSYQAPEPTLPRSPGHFTEFAEACKGGPPAMSNFDYAGRLTETILLGNVALRAGQKIEWDAKNMKITNVPEANKFLSREYRAGWEV